MNHAKRLDKASNILFFTALILAKLRVLPVVFVASMTYIASLFVSLAGYSLWIISSHFYPNQKSLDNRWYGFSQIKYQSKAAAIIGAIATVFCIAATIFPILLIPGFWLLLTSNILWCISHYHKLQSPPEYDDEFSSSQQKTYLKYTITMTAMSALNALAATTVVIFPLLTPLVFTFSIAFSAIISLIAFNFWLDCNSNQDKLDITLKSSYATIASQPRFDNTVTCEAQTTNTHHLVNNNTKPKIPHQQTVRPDSEASITTRPYHSDDKPPRPL